MTSGSTISVMAGPLRISASRITPASQLRPGQISCRRCGIEVHARKGVMVCKDCKPYSKKDQQ